MAKRWMIQKRLKEKRYREQSRGIMKQYSAARVNCGATPNKEIMSWYSNSARGLGVPYEEIARHNTQWVNSPRHQALVRRNELRNACPEWMYFRLLDDGFLRARMYFQYNPELCCVVEYNKRNKVLRRSIEYRNRDVAYQRWMNCTMDWVEPDFLYHKHIPETFEQARMPPET